MGSAQRNKIPGGAGCGPELNDQSTTLQSFDGIAAIRDHLEHLARFKEYLCAETKEISDVPLTCYAECLVAQWMHSENAKECGNRKLIETTCKCCAEFHEIAAQSVLFAEMGLSEPVADIIQSAVDFENASNRFQKALADLHVECRLNQ
jgi:hypothetical protein